MKNKLVATKMRIREAAGRFLTHKSAGVDGILVTVGLCVIALGLCVLFKDQLSTFITTIVQEMTTKAKGILAG